MSTAGIITKSLFKEFASSPKLARRHTNNKKVYDAIMHDQYAGMDGLAVGEEVENMVLQLYANQTIHKVVLNSYNNFHQNYHTITQQALHNQPDIIYQP